MSYSGGLNSHAFILNIDSGKCNISGFHEDFHQCSGQPCDAPVGPPPPPPPPCSPPPSDQEFTNNNPGDSGDCEPLILDLTGDGFHLTDTAHGVVFDIRADGHPLRVPWTADSRNGFLVLDRNGNGLVDDGSELFGNVTPQPQSAHPNGFGALAQYDWNGDGMIDDHDPIYSCCEYGSMQIMMVFANRKKCIPWQRWAFSRSVWIILCPSELTSTGTYSAIRRM